MFALGALLVFAVSAAGALDATRVVAQRDLEFFKHAAASGSFDLKASEIASARSANPALRTLAQQLASDHGKAIDELAALAARKGVSLVEFVRGVDQDVAALARRTGADFDRAYLDRILDRGEHAVDVFADAAKNSNDADINAYAEKYLPVLQRQVAKARETGKAL